MKMMFSKLFFVLILSWVLITNGSLPLQAYQSQVLLQLRKHLEYPLILKSWENYGGNLCYIPSTPQMTVKCENNVLTELRLMGDFNKHAKVSDFHGFSIPNNTLSDRFSMNSFVTTLTRLTDLKVLSLVSLGIWGQLSDKIHRLNSLEILDLSSNYLYGSVPPSISRLVKLQFLRLDSNFFNDTVPDWLNSLSNLTVLSLTDNQFKGQVPSSVTKIASLVELKLSHNELTGKLPDLSTLPSLHVLDLGENHFDSELPDMPKNLVTCLLSKNSLTGKIPDQFGKLDHLQHLDLSFNALIGSPPSILFSLPKISYLDLSSNKLSGSLAKHLNCGGELGLVDISNNMFIGELPSCLSEISNERTVKFDGNCLSVNTKDQHQEQYCEKSHVVKQSSGTDRGKLLGVIGGAVVFVILFALGVYVFCRRYRSRMTIEKNIFPKAVQDNAPSGVSAELLANARIISQSVKYGAQGASTYRIFFFEELKEATNNFDQLGFMGEGSYGKMYKGNLENGTCVAIRSLTFPKRHAIQNLKHQLDLLSRLHHPHLVTLLGHCIDGGAPDDSYAKRVFLVYEYVPSGNYHTHLSENRPEKVLQWSDRLAILIGVAKAVHFLHTGVIPGYLHNRLKTNNILLDEHHVAKLSDYAMSIFTEDNEKRELKGEGPISRRMADPEDDVYNFGFILLESLVGPIVTGKGETFLLNEMASFGSQDGRRRIVDPIVLTSCCQESLSLVVSITNKCISPELSTRPSFEDVLWNLQYAAQVQTTADADKKSDSASQS